MLLLLLSAFARLEGNPLAVVFVEEAPYVIEKEQEDCVMVVGDRGGVVSAKIRYRLREGKGGEEFAYSLLKIAVPVVVEKEAAAGVRNGIDPTVEINGIVHSPNSEPDEVLSRFEPIQVKPELRLEWFGFEIGIGPKRREVDIEVRYFQPEISGAVYYLPLFEKGKSGNRSKMHVVSETADELLVIQHSENFASVASRHLEIPMRHRMLIEVRRADANR